jgi:hypothetical protein
MLNRKKVNIHFKGGIMRRISKILTLSLVAILFASNSFAAAVLGSGYNYITFNNYENIVQATSSTPGVVGVGDIFYGIATFNAVNWESTFGDQDWLPTQNVQYIQSYFLTQVTAVIPVLDDEDNPTGEAKIEFGAASYDPNNILTDYLGQKAVMAWWESDTRLDFTTLNTALTSATDGDLWMMLSIDDGYWYSEAKTSFLDIPNGAGLGTSYYGLNLIEGVGAQIESLAIINDPNEFIAENSDVNFYGKATIEYIRPDSVFTFYSDDPAVVATPEPGTMLLLGFGLLGLGAVARRRR